MCFESSSLFEGDIKVNYSFHFFLIFAEIIEQLNYVLTTKMEIVVMKVFIVLAF